MEILAPQAEIAQRRLQAAGAWNRLAGIERVDVGAPARQLFRRSPRGPLESATSST